MSIGAQRFSTFIMSNGEAMRDIMVPAHHRALEAIKSGPGELPGWRDARHAGRASRRRREPPRREAGVVVRTVAGCCREERLHRRPDVHARPGREGWRPSSRAGRRAHPGGIRVLARGARADDPFRRRTREGPGVRHRERRRRPRTTRAASSTSGGRSRACRSASPTASTSAATFIGRCSTTSSGTSGYRPKFGLVAVNRETFERTVKPSARLLGDIARKNALGG